MDEAVPTRTAIPHELMVKSIDSWWTVLFIDPIATRVVPAISRRRSLTPMRITALAHALGVVAVVLFAVGELAVGAIVFELRFLADCIDGKVARVTGQSSTVGRFFDAFGDRVLVTAAFAAIAWTVEPVVGLVLAGAYPLSHHLLEARDGLLAQAESTKRVDRTVQGGFGAAMARRRLYPIPTSIEAEHLALFVAPLVHAAVPSALAPVLWAVAAFFTWQAARYFAGMLRAAAAVDAAR